MNDIERVDVNVMENGLFAVEQTPLLYTKTPDNYQQAPTNKSLTYMMQQS